MHNRLHDQLLVLITIFKLIPDIFILYHLLAVKVYLLKNKTDACYLYRCNCI